MAVRRCRHQNRVSSVCHCDLSRDADPASLYAARFTVSICTECGHSEFYCESRQDVCAWLAAPVLEKADLDSSDTHLTNGKPEDAS